MDDSLLKSVSDGCWLCRFGKPGIVRYRSCAKLFLGAPHHDHDGSWSWVFGSPCVMQSPARFHDSHRSRTENSATDPDENLRETFWARSLSTTNHNHCTQRVAAPQRHPFGRLCHSQASTILHFDRFRAHHGTFQQQQQHEDLLALRR